MRPAQRGRPATGRGRRNLAAGVVAACVATASLADPVLVVLRTPSSPGTGILVQELVRQGAILAARDELRLAVWDEATDGDGNAAAASNAVPCRVEVQLGPTGLHGALVIGADGRTGGTEYDLSGAVSGTGTVDYVALSVAMERLARTGFPEALRGAGLTGAPPPTAAAPDAVTNLAALQQDMCFLSQWEALGAWQAVRAREGESPACLAGLARGYAQLGLLTRPYWNRMSKAYAAQALLYAARMEVADAGSLQTRATRAYVLALAGLHARALDDIAAIAAAAGTSAVPPEVALVDAYCRYDGEALRALRETPDVSDVLPVLEALVAIAGGGQTLSARTLQESVARSPNCFMLYELWSSQPGVAIGHESTTAALAALQRLLQTRLARIEGLPDIVRAQVPASGAAVPARFGSWGWGSDGASAPDGAGRARLIDAMRASAQTHSREPSWAALGSMLESLTFLQAWHRADFMHNAWGVDASDFLAAALPALTNHPYRAFVASLGIDAGREPEALDAILRDVEMRDPNLNMRPLMRAQERIAAGARLLGTNAFAQALATLDATADDLEQQIEQTRYGEPPWGAPTSASLMGQARRLQAVSPFSPLTWVIPLDLAWDETYPTVASWPAVARQHPEVLGRLAVQSRRRARYDDAERYWKQYVAISPDHYAYRQLARAYAEQGDDGRWLATMEAFLTLPEVEGLGHASVEGEIAAYYMGRGAWTQAVRYAEMGAQSGAGWAMSTAASCYEGMQQWETAEQWVRDGAERYAGAELNWFLWCSRTGKGHVEAARALALQHVGAFDASANPEYRLVAAICYMLANQPDDAFRVWNEQFQARANPYEGLHAALIAFDKGDTATRDALLAQIGERGMSYLEQGWPRLLVVELAGLLRERLAGLADANFQQRLTRLLARANHDERTNLLYFLGRFHEIAGDEHAARGFYRSCLQTGSTQKMNYILSAAALVARGLEPRNYWLDAQRPKARGETNAYFAIMGAYLSLPDPGPAGAYLRSDMAEQYMTAQAWDKAVALLREDAEAGSWWARACLSRCCEQQNRWKEAEHWSRLLSAESEEARLNWYLLCRRVARGDPASARATVVARLAEPLAPGVDARRLEEAIFRWCEGDAATSLAILEERVKAQASPYESLLAFLAALELDRPDEAEQQLERARGEDDGSGGGSSSLDALPRLAWLMTRVRGGLEPADFAREFAMLQRQASPRDLPSLLLFAGRFHQLAGDAALADEYLRSCRRSLDACEWHRTLATIWQESPGATVTPAPQREPHP